jgi:hypothetical protein
MENIENKSGVKGIMINGDTSRVFESSSELSCRKISLIFVEFKQKLKEYKPKRT